jgi:hypothetical protein
MLLTRYNGLLLGLVLLVGSLVSTNSFTFDTLPTKGMIHRLIAESRKALASADSLCYSLATLAFLLGSSRRG